ncbi:UNVERIFIED_CONTAM: Retrovirus-related Pol polyprotein from transposon TNT 1-94 [Sesamum latifolium]|uniref:Retrovirus-related Pol polyprotein from transposon TNT 1-94 n=1 Tax=Sesamum latifolium TaxID=2727402 RepID=A0AAW2WBT5_9LAMI
MEAYDIIIQLKAIFGKAARVERFGTVTAILKSRQKDDEPVGPHVLRMIRLFENLESLSVLLGNELATDIILYTLHKGMLKTVEKSIKGEPKKNILMVQKKKIVFKKGDNKNKKKAFRKQGTGKTVAKSTKPKNGPRPLQKCFYCNQGGHWKRNCPKYLKDLKNGSVASTSGIYVIEINITSFSSWVLDTGCVSHICSNVQGLRRTRELEKGEVDLRVGNGARVVALAVGTYVLSLPSGLTLELNNCYIPSVNKNLISVSTLDSEDMDEPTTYKAAMAGADFEKWLIAMKSEMESVYDNQVWNLVDLPKGTRPIVSKWIYKIKTDMDGKIVVYKAQVSGKRSDVSCALSMTSRFQPCPSAVSWKSSKQNTVEDSTTEAEYIAAAEAAKEAVWIKNFIAKLGVVPSVASPIELYCDSNGAIAQAKEPTPNQKFKHVERKFHLIRDIVERKDIKVCKIITDDNVVDPLTKPMS